MIERSKILPEFRTWSDMWSANLKMILATSETEKERHRKESNEAYQIFKTQSITRQSTKERN
jgi:hypothetical protein